MLPRTITLPTTIPMIIPIGLSSLELELTLYGLMDGLPCERSIVAGTTAVFPRAVLASGMLKSEVKEGYIHIVQDTPRREPTRVQPASFWSHSNREDMQRGKQGFSSGQRDQSSTNPVHQRLVHKTDQERFGIKPAFVRQYDCRSLSCVYYLLFIMHILNFSLCDY